MDIVLWLVKAIIFVVLILSAAFIGMCLGAVFGLFMGPLKIIEWVGNSNADVSTDAI